MKGRIERHSLLVSPAEGDFPEAATVRDAGLDRVLSLLQATLEATGEGILAVDLNGRTVAYNQELVAMWGIPESALAADGEGFPLAASARMEDPQDFLARTREIFARPEQKALDLLRLRDGRIFERFCHPQRLDGRIVGRVASFRDVTAQKRAEEEQRSALEHLRKFSRIIEQSPNAIFIADREGRVEYVNPGYCLISGFAAEEAVGKKFCPLNEEIPAPQQHPGLWRAMLASEDWQEELRNRKKDGEPYWERVTVSPVKNGDGVVTHFVGVKVDVTASVLAAEGERRNRELSEAVAAATLRFLQTGSLPELAQTLIERCAEITGAPFGFLYDLQAGGEARFLATAGEIPAGVDARGLFDFGQAHLDEESCFLLPPADSLLFAPVREGRTILFAARPADQGAPVASFLGAPLRAGSKVVGVIGLINRPGGFGERERTELEVFAQTAALAVQAARTELARQQAVDHVGAVQKFEAIGRLAGGIAHDFNNLLTVINGYGELLLRAFPKGEPLRRDAEAIVDAGERAANLTRQLLAFSRRQVLEPEVLNLNTLIRGLEKILRRLIREDISILLSLDEGIGQVMADPGQMEQILLNLVINARDAMPGGGAIHITTGNAEFDRRFIRRNPGAVAGRYVMFAVSDTGTGMPEHVRQRIFEPFFTTKEQGRGTGLGLATVYGIVKQSEGYIRVDSAPGLGSTFQVFLPRLDATAREERSEAREPLPQGRETILVVEDEDWVLDLTARVLEINGYRVLRARTPQAARTLFADHRQEVDLLLTDVVMPEMSGQQLATELRDRQPELPVLFMSGYGEFHGEKGFDPEKGEAFLQKPFAPDTLLQKVQATLKKDRHPEGE